MKVIMVNGSPNAKGCTYTALTQVAAGLREYEADTEIMHIGSQKIGGCLACNACKNTGLCLQKDVVNEFLQTAKDADGFVFGSPVHYASASGSITCFLDRCFFAGGAAFAHKPGAAVVSCRRAGSTAALDQLNKYLSISNMLIVTSQYWNMVHGKSADEVFEDKEGMQTMLQLGRNMGWLLRNLEAGKAAGIPAPRKDERQWTNFVR